MPIKAFNAYFAGFFHVMHAVRIHHSSATWGRQAKEGPSEAKPRPNTGDR